MTIFLFLEHCQAKFNEKKIYFIGKREFKAIWLVYISPEKENFDLHTLLDSIGRGFK